MTKVTGRDPQSLGRTSLTLERGHDQGRHTQRGERGEKDEPDATQRPDGIMVRSFKMLRGADDEPAGAWNRLKGWQLAGQCPDISAGEVLGSHTYVPRAERRIIRHEGLGQLPRPLGRLRAEPIDVIGDDRVEERDRPVMTTHFIAEDVVVGHVRPRGSEERPDEPRHPDDHVSGDKPDSSHDQ
ncbi:hypothetical protein [Dactylosporangium sp. NPDC051541]|uniref:hypothetical protein n=1 Tax=Dactylosporangium sp. NPDC051541 TaxID=3363977 RepID=UPI003788BAB5